MSREKTTRPTALVTGASRGIGPALAWEFARNGHDLVLVARNEEALERATGEIQARTAAKARWHALDLASADAPQALHRWVSDTGIEVDVLVNNAGIGDYGPLADASEQRQRSLLQLNVLALTSLTQLFLEPMLARGRGRILNVASLVAYFAGGANWTTYVASKSYVLAFTRGLAAELRGSGVTATVLAPGTTATDFVEDAHVGDTRAYRWLPKLSVEHVARAGYRAAMRGSTEVVPGVHAKVLAFLGELHPRAVSQAVFSFLSRPVATRKARGPRSVELHSGEQASVGAQLSTNVRGDEPWDSSSQPASTNPR